MTAAARPWIQHGEPETHGPAGARSMNGGVKSEQAPSTMGNGIEARHRNGLQDLVDASPRMAEQKKKLRGFHREDNPVQRQVKFEGVLFTKPYANNTKEVLIKAVREISAAYSLKRGGIAYIENLVREDEKHKFATVDDLAAELIEKFGSDSTFDRKNFTKQTLDLATVTSSIAAQKDLRGISRKENDLAIIHRYPFKALRIRIQAFCSAKEDPVTLTRWTDRLLKGTLDRMVLNVKSDPQREYHNQSYINGVKQQIAETEKSRELLIGFWTRDDGIPKDKNLYAADLLNRLNNLHGNVPDLGPHTTVNIPVGGNIHLNISEGGEASPTSAQVNNMSPLESIGVALTSDGANYPTTSGRQVPRSLYDSPHKPYRTRIPTTPSTPYKPPPKKGKKAQKSSS